jgi:hypothetical protein
VPWLERDAIPCLSLRLLTDVRWIARHCAVLGDIIEEWRVQIRLVIKNSLSEWKGLLAQNVPIARQILRKVLEGRLVFVPRTRATNIGTSSAEGGH